MSLPKAVHYLLCFVLLFGVLGGLVGDRVVLATQESSSGSFLSSLNQEQPSPEDKLELISKHLTFEGYSGDSFEFEVGLRWLGSEARVFDLTITDIPPRWDVLIMAGFPEKKVSDIGLGPEMTRPENIKVILVPLLGEFPEPGDYTITLEASSGDINETVELKAVVTALYRFAFYTVSGRLSTEVTAGVDNHLSIKAWNSGQVVIEKITFLSEKPEGWSITFNPNDVESLEPGLAQEVDVVIKPPRKTIAGDYMITMTAATLDLAPREIDIRVTVLTPMTGLLIGILVVLAVIAGLAVMFRRLGRR